MPSIMNKEEEPIYAITDYGTQSWRLKNGKLHKLDGPAIIYQDGSRGWYIHGRLVYITPLELSVAKTIPWGGPWSDSIAIVIKQINHVLFQILVGNQKIYVFSTHNCKNRKGTTLLL